VVPEVIERKCVDDGGGPQWLWSIRDTKSKEGEIWDRSNGN